MAGGDTSIGERIAIIRRRRGMSQAAVAGRLGRSEQWLSNIERGERSADRYSLLVPISDVLGVSVAELTGEREQRHAPPAAGDATVRALRLALSGHRHPDSVAADGADNAEMIDRVRCAWRLAHDTRYGELGELLPDLIRDCELAVWNAAPAERVEWSRLLAELYQAVAAVMAKLGQADAAWVAADRSVFAAMHAGDALLAAAGGFRLGHAFLANGRLDQAERAAQTAVDALEGPAQTIDRDALTLWGALNLVRAVAAARQADAAGAWAAIRRAEEAAELLGPLHHDERFDTEFGAQNVGVHAVSVAAELGEAAEALRRFEGFDVRGLSPERTARLLLDVARAHAQRRRPDAVFRFVQEAERLAPEMVRRHWLARETIRDLLRRGRGRMQRDRAGLAVRLGLA